MRPACRRSGSRGLFSFTELLQASGDLLERLGERLVELRVRRLGCAAQRVALERQQAAAELETRLSEARLQALRAQVQPHFLFNTLNAISSLVYAAPPRAVQCVARLSDLLRASLDATATREVPLAQEIDNLRNYLDIMEIRFAERLATTMEIPPEVGGALVPSLVLQPLVENAVRHAVAPRPQGGTIAVRAARRDAELWLEVEDDGPGIAPDDLPRIFDRFYRADEARSSPGSGLGLTIARRIVEAHRGEIRAESEPGCTKIIMSFPREGEP